jgi:hypothetical protein
VPCGRPSRRRRCWWWRPRGSTCRRRRSRWPRPPRCPRVSCCLAPSAKLLASAPRRPRAGIRARDAPVRYSVISGSNAAPAGTAANTRWRYAVASARLRTGGFRFGITTARPNTRAVKGTTEASDGPSRRCRCLRRKSGGRSSGRAVRCRGAAGRAPVVWARDGELRDSCCGGARRNLCCAHLTHASAHRRRAGPVGRSRRQHARCEAQHWRGTGSGRASVYELRRCRLTSSADATEAHHRIMFSFRAGCVSVWRVYTR